MKSFYLVPVDIDARVTEALSAVTRRFGPGAEPLDAVAPRTF
jgi:hypothetical protein